METERFEALIDAILAIIITLIVMEIPLPETTSIYSLIELYPEFITYALSFMICFTVWNYHHNLFNVVNKLNSKVTWTSAVSIMVVGLLPHVTTMVSENFYSFTAQFMFGLIFILSNISFYLVDWLLIQSDKANIALILILEKRAKITLMSLIFQIFGFILGYFLWPPLILIFCLIPMILARLPLFD